MCSCPSNLYQWLFANAQLQQTCISNMLAIATNDFGCAQGDVVCYCNNADFGYGVRDCANEACGSEQAASVIAYGTNYCAGK